MGFIPTLAGIISDPQDPNEIPDIVGRLGLLTVHSPAFGAIADLFGRPYFRRAWIVQEAALGSEVVVQCGSFTMDWQSLVSAALCLVGESHDDRIEGRDVMRMMASLKRQLRNNETRPLTSLLYQTYRLECSDPRDKVFAILGLASDITHGEILPDYLLSTQDVYRRVATYIISRDLDLNMLSNVHYPKKLSGTPCWVPDWSITSLVAESFGLEYWKNHPNSAPTKTAVRFSNHGLTLNIKGCIADTIQSMGSVMPQESRSLVAREWDAIARSASPDPLGKTYPTNFWATMTALDTSWASETQRNARFHLYESWRNLVERNESAYSNPAWKPIHEFSVVNERSAEFETLIAAFSTGRRMFLTADGYIGLAPANARVGDQVCTLEGASVPFVLRQAGDEKGYDLVGESYLLGWKDGKRPGGSIYAKEDFALV